MVSGGNPGNMGLFTILLTSVVCGGLNAALDIMVTFCAHEQLDGR